MRPVSFWGLAVIAAGLTGLRVGAGDPAQPGTKPRSTDPAILKSLHPTFADRPDDALLKLVKENPGLVHDTDDSQCTALHHAARYGKVETVRWLINQKANVNARAYNQFTPLHFAHDRVIKMLAAAKADLEAISLGETPLEKMADHAGRLPKGPDNPWWPAVTSLRDAGARYTLRAALRLGDADRAKELLAADPAAARSPDLMREAARSGHAAAVRLLLGLRADPTDADYGGLPLLYFALDHPEVVKVLLAAGASAKGPLRYEGDGQGPAEGSTLLHEAADHGRTEAARLLIDAGAEVDARTKNGATPAQWAAANGHFETVKLLVKKGADLRGERGAVAMTAAARQICRPGGERYKGDNDRRTEVVRYLASQGVPLDLTTAIALGRTDRAAELLKDRPERAKEVEPGGRPLAHRAVMLDRVEILAMMLDAGAPVDAADEYGDTTLHAAAFWGRDRIVELLIRRKVTVDARDKNGATPLAEAARLGNPGTIQALLAAGADVNARDDKGRTPLAWAEIAVERNQRSDEAERKASIRARDLLREHGAKK